MSSFQLNTILLMFFSNRVSSLPSDKSICSSSPSSMFLSITDRHSNNTTATNNKKSRSSRIYQRLFSRNNNNNNSRQSIESTITPCLSASTSASSFDSSSFSISKKMSSETQSSKSSEFESLIVDHPSRTVRVTLTPMCAA
ncbi:hypothetical protein BDA99DRAFT_572617 [Phascolomyces articulosus]|uniref:Uncharacterized protein n=1 Tax=Phascolomyces articulosus TaxID=60185 RepID=A0AAD5K7T9_9FUNG|nr:hypothetical protein BDA99DRAFT_572617 [Phascolomyces articulosus]